LYNLNEGLQCQIKVWDDDRWKPYWAQLDPQHPHNRVEAGWDLGLRMPIRREDSTKHFGHQIRIRVGSSEDDWTFLCTRDDKRAYDLDATRIVIGFKYFARKHLYLDYLTGEVTKTDVNRNGKRTEEELDVVPAPGHYGRAADDIIPDRYAWPSDLAVKQLQPPDGERR